MVKMRKKAGHIIRIPIGLAATTVLLLWCSSSSAQPPSSAAINQATRITDQAIRDQVSRRMMAPPKAAPRPEEAVRKPVYTGPTFFVKAIKLEGTETFPAEDFRSIVGPYENREVYEDEIKETLTSEISRAYLKRGVIATCFVPPQEIVEGVITLRVVEAKMGELKVNKARYYLKDRLPFYWPIKQGEVIRIQTMSRALQIMNKNPDREVTSTLATGSKPGTTDVILTQKTYFPIHITSAMDNEGTVPTGKTRTSIGFVENNFLGLDDTVMGGYQGGKSFGSAYIYHRIPITGFGTSLLYGFNQSRAFPKKDFTQYGISSNAQSASAFIYQDLYTKDVYKGDISAGLERSNKHVVENNGTVNDDRLCILRLGPSFLARDEKSVAYVQGIFSEGLNFLGARRESIYSSRSAENTFLKLALNAQFQRLLVHGIRGQVRFASQFASEKLTPQEELYMGGIDSVRGYPSGDYLADSGAVTNLELLVPAFFLPDWLAVPYGERALKDEITGIFFFDHGYGTKRGQLPGEQSARKMFSLGAGVRLRILNIANLRLEWGFPLDGANPPITEFSRSRLHFSVDAQDNLDRDITRLVAEIKRKNVEAEAWALVSAVAREPASSLGAALQRCWDAAEAAERAGDLKEARIQYSMVATLCRAAHQRAVQYITTMRETVDYLKSQDTLARTYEARGDLAEARKVSRRIVEAAAIPPFAYDMEKEWPTGSKQ